MADELRRATGCDVGLVLVETTGDRRRDVPLHVIGGQGVFVKEVQQAVLEGRADAAVHSAKDLPSVAHDALAIRAFLPRRDAADALIGRCLAELAAGATVATGSVRRRAQLAAARPDLRFIELRGNIGTRLDRIPDGGSIVMAMAALQVLGLTERVAERLAPEQFVPAVGQGCVAVEARSDDEATAGLLAALDDPPTRHAVEVERSFLAELGSGCTLPVGAHVSESDAPRVPRIRRPSRRCGGVRPRRRRPRTRRRRPSAGAAGGTSRQRGGRVVSGRLDGVRVGVTRPEAGELADRLTVVGAAVVHVPLIEVADAADGGAALRRALARLASFDWLVVTSANGAVASGRRRPAIPPSDSPPSVRRRQPRSPRLPAARSTSYRRSPTPRGCWPSSPGDPHGCCWRTPTGPGRCSPTGWRRCGHRVESVTAYRTVVRRPTPAEVERLAAVDAVVFASGSAATGWVAACGTAAPPVVVAIGPVTADVARRNGLAVTHVATSPDAETLCDLLTRAFERRIP